MINKQNLWLITCLSLIVVLSIYYISLPEQSNISMVSSSNNLSEVVEINEADVLIALKVEEEERLLGEIEDAKQLLLNNSSSVEQKNNAYKTIQSINKQKGQMQKIEKMLKEKFNVNACVKMDSNSINIIISGNELTIDEVNKIINEVQNLYDETKYITIKFQK